MRDILIMVIAYGLGWGAYYFWGFERKKRRVLAQPELYSAKIVRFYTQSTVLHKASLSFLLALSVPAVIAVFLAFAWFLFK